MARIAALLMAAGSSRRMGGPNKLLLPFQNQPLINFSVAAVRDAQFFNRIIITGRDSQMIESHAPDFEVVHNPVFELGFGTSLAAGFSALEISPEIDGAMVLLADMPLISFENLNQLMARFEMEHCKSVMRAACLGVPGNPVIVPKSQFAAMSILRGEQSGQPAIAASGLPVVLVEIGNAALADADTPEALAALQEASL